MNQNHITIVIDAMGGDNSPNKVIKGCEIFLNDNKMQSLIPSHLHQDLYG